ncbi:HlyD family secretion protein [Vibrio thalassae]|uniref:HlyD family secretion protein n=1 Tax=Vibrio thalassae TaxID=1243014 RepID=A0A240EMS5_9VIBR|nr:HlyD family secretion protein [Vibrio thalassae]
MFIVFSILFSLVGCQSDDNGKALSTLERDRVTFSATANEIIRDLPIREGSMVKTGDVLVRLDTKRQEAILAHAIAEEAKASANRQSTLGRVQPLFHSLLCFDRG